MAAFRWNTPTLRRVGVSASFPARIMPAGTAKGSGAPVTPHTHFNRSMAAQASRVPRLANIQAAALAIRTGRGTSTKRR